jgi:hypothetical protein
MAANANINAERHHARIVEAVRQDFDDGPPAPVCGPMLFGVGAVSAVLLSILAHAGAWLVLDAKPGPATRTIATVAASTAGMLYYAHMAGDLVTQRAIAAVAAAELAGALVVLYLEQCCRPGSDWLLMAFLPNAIAVVVYTGLRDLGVLMRVQYGHVDKATQAHYRRRSTLSRQEKLDEEIALLERELGV